MAVDVDLASAQEASAELNSEDIANKELTNGELVIDVTETANDEANSDSIEEHEIEEARADEVEAPIEEKKPSVAAEVTPAETIPANQDGTKTKDLFEEWSNLSQKSHPRIPLSGDGFQLSAYDEQATMRIGFLFQPRLIAVDNTVNGGNFFAAINHARFNLGGQLFHPAFHYFFQVEFADSAHLLDAEIRVQPWDELGLRIGQFRTATSRQWLAPLWGLAFAGRSAVSDFFRQGREIGVEALGDCFDKHLGYSVGIFNGAGENAVGRESGDYLLTGRLSYSPWGSFAGAETLELEDSRDALTLSVLANSHGHAAVTDAVTPVPQQQLNTLGADATWHFNHLFATAEAYYQYQNFDGAPQVKNWGSFVQADYFIIPKRLDVGARFNYIKPDIGNAGELIGFDAELSYYLMGNHLKMNAQYTFVQNTSTWEKNFATGTTNQFILQMQINI